MKKRMIFVFAAVLISAATFSQGFGVRAGVNMQNINGKDVDGGNLKNDMIIGFSAGVNYEIGIAEGFFLQPGLNFATKGSKIDAEYIKGTANLSYLELPIHLVYKPVLGTGKIIVGFGPYLGYGIMGKFKPEGMDDVDITFKGDISEAELMEMATYQEFYAKGFDAGADIFFGYEFPFKLSVQFNAQLGLLSMSPSYEGDDNDDSAMKNTGFGLSFGYRF